MLGKTGLEEPRVTNVINKHTHRFYVEKTNMKRITQNLKQTLGLPTTSFSSEGTYIPRPWHASAASEVRDTYTWRQLWNQGCLGDFWDSPHTIRSGRNLEKSIDVSSYKTLKPRSAKWKLSTPAWPARSSGKLCFNGPSTSPTPTVVTVCALKEQTKSCTWRTPTLAAWFCAQRM